MDGWMDGKFHVSFNKIICYFQTFYHGICSVRWVVGMGGTLFYLTGFLFSDE